MLLHGAMRNNKLMIAAAGAGKTTFLVKKACSTPDKKVLITTFTEANEKEIRTRIVANMGYMPVNITVQTWFSFLLQHGVKPYQSVLSDEIHASNIGFYLISEKSGKKLNVNGSPILVNGRPIYWGSKDFKKHYFTINLKIYSDKISKFVFETNKASDGEVMSRTSKIFDRIYIDEVQDLAGYDLELIKLLFKSDSTILLVGDPRQVTYLTHHSTKYGKYADGKIKEFVENELGKRIECVVDEETLNYSHRNNLMICEYSSKLYPDLAVPTPCACNGCRSKKISHEGVFLVKPNDVGKYLSDYSPMQLRWSSAVSCDPQYSSMNFGESKGATFDRVLIYPTKDMRHWIKDISTQLKNETKSKLYVALTRARYSAAIIMDFGDDNEFDGVKLYNV